MSDARLQRRLLIALLVALVALGGCSGERSFDEDTFIEEINSAGAGLTLGVIISENEQGVPVRAIELVPAGASRPVRPGEDPGGGTMLVLDDADQAFAEFQRCEQAATLTCYRAANVVLRFDQIDPVQQQRVTAAIAALESG